MKSYRTVDEVLADRRQGTKLSEVVESILNSPYVLERIDTPFDLVQGLHPNDYLDISTEVWRELPVGLQIKYSSAYQTWYAYQLGCESIEGTFELVPGVETTMMLIPPMKYWMGSPETELARYADEKQKLKLIKKPCIVIKTIRIVSVAIGCSRSSTTRTFP